jgi:hypothetical protein
VATNDDYAAPPQNPLIDPARGGAPGRPRRRGRERGNPSPPGDVAERVDSAHGPHFPATKRSGSGRLTKRAGGGFGALSGFPVLRELLAGRDRGTGGQQRAEFLAFEPVVDAVEVGVSAERIFVREHEPAHPRAPRSGLQRELAVVALGGDERQVIGEEPAATVEMPTAGSGIEGDRERRQRAEIPPAIPAGAHADVERLPRECARPRIVEHELEAARNRPRRQPEAGAANFNDRRLRAVDLKRSKGHLATRAAQRPRPFFARIEHEGVAVVFLCLAHAREAGGRERIDGKFCRRQLRRLAWLGRVLQSQEPEQGSHASRCGYRRLCTESRHGNERKTEDGSGDFQGGGFHGNDAKWTVEEFPLFGSKYCIKIRISFDRLTPNARA